MTPEAQRIAIAEACGWTDITDIPFRPGVSDESPSFGLFGTKNKNCIKYGQQVPNYPSDLNAMHSAIMSLKPEQLAYYEQLMVNKFGFTKAITTSAEQQAEQFLRALNLWIDHA